MNHPPHHIFQHTPASLKEWCAERGMKPFRAKQILEWVYTRGVIDPAEMTNLSAQDRETLAAEMTFLSGPTVAHQRATDGTQKLLIEWPDDLDAGGISADEAVIDTGNRLALLGDDEQARLAFNEAAFRQEASVVDRISSIDIARQANGVDLARSVEAGMSDPAVEAVLASVRAFEPYRGFTNPFAEMLHAVYRLAAPRDDADRERGVALLRSVVGTTDNAHARDLLIETQEPSGDRAPSVHIFFASGFCPIREEIRIDLPLVLLNDTIDYVGLAFPRLAFDDRAVPYLDAETPDASVRTETLADMDRLMAVEYREEFPTLLTRAILAAGAKIAASYGINEATRDDETLNAAARIAAGLYLYSQNRADTRGWATLPKTYSYARLPAPRDGEILLGTPAVQKYVLEAREGELLDIIRKSLEEGMVDFTTSLVRLVETEWIHHRVALEATPKPEELKMRLKGIS